MKSFPFSTIAFGVAALFASCVLAGCAVSNHDVNTAYDAAEDKIDAAASAGAPSTLPLYEIVHTAYLGNTSVPLSYEAKLPAVFKDSMVSFPGALPISEIARRISLATGIPVRVRPDVNLAESENGPATGGSRGLAAPMPNGFPVIAGLTAHGSYSEPTFQSDLEKPLAKYLEALCASTGLDWNYDGKSIQIYRYITRSFTLAVIPGTVNYNSSMNKGTNTSTGTQTTGSATGSATNGSFTSTTMSSRSGGFDPIASLQTALDGVKTSKGHVTIDPATRLIVITDTKDAVETMTKIIEHDNAILTRRVAIRVHDVKIQLNDQSQAGVSTAVLFTAIQNSLSKYAVAVTSPQSLLTAQGGSLGLTVLKPNAPLSTTSAMLTALSQYGKVVDDNDRTPQTMNGVPIRLANFDSLAYLAQTTPAASVIGGTSGGIPGLTPGIVTTGDFVNLIPAVQDDNTILLSYTDDNSQLLKLDSQSSGNGASEQLIQLPHTAGADNDQFIGVADGQTVVMYGTMTNHFDSTSNAGVGGGSGIWNKNKVLEIITVTPTILSSL